MVVAVGIVALRESNEIWDSGLFTLTLGVLLISILLAIHSKEFRRAFWLGFALFGWTYLGLSLVPSIESRLLTTKGLAYLDSKVPGRSLPGFVVRFTGNVSGAPITRPRDDTFTTAELQFADSSQGQVKIWDLATGRFLSGWSGTTENFVTIGHSLFALLAGWFGGELSSRIWRASRPPGESTTGLS